MMHTYPEPYLVAETASYLLVYKPPGLASAPLSAGEQNTLLHWCRSRFPETGRILGRKAIEGGLLHRLDTDTNGLVLFARSQAAYDNLMNQQVKGQFVKYYRAWCQKVEYFEDKPISGFPPAPGNLDRSLKTPLEIASAFRPYGPGRKQVRPVMMPLNEGDHPGNKELALDRQRPYKTMIRSIRRDPVEPSIYEIDIKIERGFRHQIRCHLSWIGLPILADPLYNPLCSPGCCGEGPLALQAYAVEFQDPGTNEEVRYELSSSNVVGGIV